MSTLERTIDLLNILPESKIEIIYSFAQFLSLEHETAQKDDSKESIDAILSNIIGIIPDSGKTLENYREERIRE